MVSRFRRRFASSRRFYRPQHLQTESGALTRFNLNCSKPEFRAITVRYNADRYPNGIFIRRPYLPLPMKTRIQALVRKKRVVGRILEDRSHPPPELFYYVNLKKIFVIKIVDFYFFDVDFGLLF